MSWFARASASLVSSRSYRGPSRATSGSHSFSHLLKTRNLFLYDEISTATATVLMEQLMFLDSNDSGKLIQLFINSCGGSISTGMAIYDTMNYIHAPIHTICVGHAYSMASLILAAGTAGKCCTFPHASIMIHQPSNGFFGPVSHHYNHVNAMLKIRQESYVLFAKYTGQPLKLVKTLIDRETFFNPEEAKGFGLIDKIIERRPGMM